MPGVPHLGQVSLLCSRNSPQLAHHKSSAPHWAQKRSAGPREPPHWRQVMVVVMQPPGDVPSREDALYCGPVRRGAIRERSTAWSSDVEVTTETVATELAVI